MPAEIQVVEPKSPSRRSHSHKNKHKHKNKHNAHRMNNKEQEKQQAKEAAQNDSVINENMNNGMVNVSVESGATANGNIMQEAVMTPEAATVCVSCDKDELLEAPIPNTPTPSCEDLEEEMGGASKVTVTRVDEKKLVEDVIVGLKGEDKMKKEIMKEGEERTEVSSGLLDCGETHEVSLKSEVNSVAGDALDDADRLEGEKAVEEMAWSNTVNRIYHIPIVESAISKASEAYLVGKDSNDYVRYSCEKLENTASSLYSKAAVPMLKHVVENPHFKYADQLGYDKMNGIEEKYPVLKQPAEELYKTGREYFIGLIATIPQMKSYPYEICSNLMKRTPSRKEVELSLQEKLLDVLKASENIVDSVFPGGEPLAERKNNEAPISRVKNMSAHIKRGAMAKASEKWEHTLVSLANLKAALDKFAANMKEENIYELKGRVLDRQVLSEKYAALTNALAEYIQHIRNNETVLAYSSDVLQWGRSSVASVSEETAELRGQLKNKLNEGIASMSALSTRVKDIVSNIPEEDNDGDCENDEFYVRQAKRVLRLTVNQINLLKSYSKKLGEQLEAQGFRSSGDGFLAQENIYYSTPNHDGNLEQLVDTQS
eukprot:Nk52_evm60s1360 gene=Nk52_evmTU60s1360